MANNSLICKDHVRECILRRTKEIRTEWKCTRVSEQVFDDLNHKVRTLIDDAIKRHPTRGQTFTQILS